MNGNLSVDILLPTYNGGKYLESQIKSILEQDFTNFRLLIRDDGSSDLTLDQIQQFCGLDARVIYLKDDFGNLGLVKNIEVMLKQSDADLIFFSDQDDVWLPSKISIFLANYNPTDNPQLIHSNCFVTDANLKIRCKFLNDKVASKKSIQNSFFHYYVQGASSMINREMMNILLPFLDEVYIHDRYFHIMAEIFGTRTYISEPTMLYRQHGGNLIGSKSFLSKLKNIKLDKNFYLKQDRDLFYALRKKYPKNNALNLYYQLTDKNQSRFKKLGVLKKNKISLRFKEFILLILNN